MTAILLALAIGGLSLGVVGLLGLTLALVRQNGRLLLRVEKLELEVAEISGLLLDLNASQMEKLFLAQHPWLHIRDGSNDLDILREIASNIYHLPQSFSENDVIVDIGAHIGLFAVSALDRGCGLVYCYEPEPGNINQAREHLEPYGERVRLSESAVWRSDREERLLYFQPSEDQPWNLGGGNVLHDSGLAVSTLRFNDVMLKATDGGKGRIRYLKLDCEGSEYPILLTSDLLHLVDEIAGEYHKVPSEVSSRWKLDREVSIDSLCAFLTSSGFEVSATPCGGDSNAEGMFYARRPERVSTQT